MRGLTAPGDGCELSRQEGPISCGIRGNGGVLGNCAQSLALKDIVASLLSFFFSK